MIRYDCTWGAREDGGRWREGLARKRTPENVRGQFYRQRRFMLEVTGGTMNEMHDHGHLTLYVVCNVIYFLTKDFVSMRISTIAPPPLSRTHTPAHAATALPGLGFSHRGGGIDYTSAKAKIKEIVAAYVAEHQGKIPGQVYVTNQLVQANLLGAINAENLKKTKNLANSIGIILPK